VVAGFYRTCVIDGALEHSPAEYVRWPSVPAAALAAGWNPMYGQYLVTDLQRARLGRVAGRAHRSYEPGGGAWAGVRLGIERMRDKIQHAGAGQAEWPGHGHGLPDRGRSIQYRNGGR